MAPTRAGEPMAGVGSSSAVQPASVESALDREVFGFVRASYLDEFLAHADFSALSTVAFFSLDALPSGRLRKRSGGTETSGWSTWTGPRLDQLVDRAHAAGTRVVLTITRFAWSDSGYADTVRLLSRPGARSRLVRQIVRQVMGQGVDGVNIDFEPIPGSQKRTFVTFIRDLRAALDAARPGLYLTFDATGYVANYDIRRLTAPGAADAVFIMGYPYAGPWSDRAGSVAPLSGPLYDVTDTVDRYLALTSADKLILGVPYFGYEWSTATSDVHSRTRPKGPRYGWPAEVPLDGAMDMAATHGRLWDAQQKGPWARWRYRACGSCPETWRQIHYEDAESLGLKYDLVNDRGLRGAGIWSLGYEGDRTEFYELLLEKFAAP